MDFLSPDQFASFVKARGLPYSFGEDIKQLWSTGVLKADLVESECDLDIPGLKLLEIDDEGDYQYADNRDSSFPNGLRDSIGKQTELPCEVKLYFHPFRYFVLFQLNQNFRPNIHTKQYFLHASGYHKLIDFWIDEFDKWSSNPRFGETLQYWEMITELVVATEPYLYPRLFGRIRGDIVSMQSGMDNWRTVQRNRINEHWTELKMYYKNVAVDELEEARQRLCIAAETLDPNKTVHTILRLTQGEKRINNIKGSLGGSMLLLTMAEMMRRASEEVFGIELPEEDEKGFGVVFPKIKEELYGSRRLLDGSTKVAENFLRFHGLHYSLRVRWYVEGETEYYAIKSVFGDINTVEVVNLRGQVIEKKGKGLALRDSLIRDIHHHVFSWISLDADKNDNIRVLRKAAENDELFGAFYVWEPDFEFANFTIDELAAIAWEYALKEGANPNDRTVFDDSVMNSKSGKEFESNVRRSLPLLNNFGKGQDWGEALIKYAFEHPEKADTGKTRPIIDAIQRAWHAMQLTSYKSSRDKMKVDPRTGKPVLVI